MTQPVAQSLGKRGSGESDGPVTGSPGAFWLIGQVWLLGAAVVGVQLAQIVSGGGQ